MRELLAQHGDAGSIERRIDYGFLPLSSNKSASRLKELNERFELIGVRSAEHLDENFQQDNVAKFYDIREVESDEFVEWCMKLNKIANDCGWVFDGWETFVVNQPDAEQEN